MYYAPEGLSTDLMVLSYCGPNRAPEAGGKGIGSFGRL